MKKCNIALIVAAASFTLAACDGTGGSLSDLEELAKVQFNTTADTWGTETIFESGDQAGLFAQGAVTASNQRLMYDGSTLVSIDGDLKWNLQDSCSAQFAAYFPYKQGLSASNGTFAVSEDQSTEDACKSSDLLMATASLMPSASAVNLKFKHAMARLCIFVDNQSGCEIKSVKVEDAITSAWFDLYQATAQTDSTAARSSIEAALYQKSSGESYYCVLLPPQSASVKVTVWAKTKDGSVKSVSFPLEGTSVFASGQQWDNSRSPIVLQAKYFEEESGASEVQAFTVEISDWADDGTLIFKRKQ